MFERFNALMDKLWEKDVDEAIKVQDITNNLEEVDYDEWEEVYNSVGKLGKEIMDLAEHDFADNAIGDSSWREGTDWED